MLSKGSTNVERGSLPLPSGSRAAVIASYGTGPSVSRSLATLVKELRVAGYPTIVVRASDDVTPLEWPEGFTGPDVIIRKPNIGYDFGSLAVGLFLAPEVLARDKVLLVNDSLLGPFATLGPLIADFESSSADAWGACHTMQVIPHLQSFFLGFRRGVLSDPSLRAFWSSVRHHEDKARIIENYELGLSRLLYSEAFSSAAAFDSERLVHPTDNPTIAGWKRLIDLGMPFVKRELYINPLLAVDGHEIRSYIMKTFNEDPEEW